MQSFRRLLVELPAKCIAFDVLGQFAIGEGHRQRKDDDKRNETKKKKKEAASRHGNSTFLMCSPRLQALFKAFVR